MEYHKHILQFLKELHFTETLHPLFFISAIKLHFVFNSPRMLFYRVVVKCNQLQPALYFPRPPSTASCTSGDMVDGNSS